MNPYLETSVQSTCSPREWGSWTLARVVCHHPTIEYLLSTKCKNIKYKFLSSIITVKYWFSLNIEADRIQKLLAFVRNSNERIYFYPFLNIYSSSIPMIATIDSTIDINPKKLIRIVWSSIARIINQITASLHLSTSIWRTSTILKMDILYCVS